MIKLGLGVSIDSSDVHSSINMQWKIQPSLAGAVNTELNEIRTANLHTLV